MAFLMLTYVSFLVACVCGEISSGESEIFPLDDCSTDEMDVLFLYFDTKNASERSYQWFLCDQFVKDLLSFSSGKTTRVMVADVVDKFSSLNPLVNVSSWRFHTTHVSDPYGLDAQQARRQQYRNVQETVDQKVNFVKRLFSEMSGVRQNATYIGVIFIDGSSFSDEASRRVPHILQQQDTAVKIFAVIMGGQYGTRTVYLRDTLIVDESVYYHSKHVLTLAVCHRCMEGWFMSERKERTHSLSCYKLLASNVSINWNQAWDMCHEQGVYLAIVGTRTELNYLQTKLHTYFIELINRSQDIEQSAMFTAYVYIGLQRDLTSRAKRFQWLMSNPPRPLVVNNWMPGNPSQGSGIGCGVWKFVYNYQSNDTTSSTNVNQFVDGWVDIECEASILSSFSLCEMAFPLRIVDDNFMRFKPATNDSFNHALAKGDFTIFRNNIVSVSSNIANTDFLKFLQQTGSEFPLFDCGVNEDLPRYISYVYVCDFLDHCRNRRDETVCMLEPQMTRSQDRQTQICKSVYCCDGSCLPVQWVNDGEIDCFVCGYGSEKKIHDESEVVINYLRRNEACAFVCNLDTCVHHSQLNDGRANCIGPEGPLDETIGRLQAADTCYDSLGHRVWAPKCVYVRDMLDAILGCRDLSHLVDCAGFECQDGYIKCPNTYCIPQHYVLDGKVDCPSAEDEQIDSIGPCSRNFACFDKTMCLHPDLVCDGHPDCPLGDDEVDCDVTCVDGFHCVSGTVYVLDYNRSIFPKNVYPIDRRVRYIDLSGVDLSDLDDSWLILLENVIFIIWSKCKIGQSIVRYIYFIKRVWKLDLSYNLIHVLDGNYIDYFPLQNIRHLNLSYNMELVVVKYLQLPFLETLDLSHTGLSEIDDSFLAGLTNLKYLNLSFTFISNFAKSVFSSRLNLHALDLRHLYITGFKEDLFNGLVVSQDLFTDSFELCCPKIRGANIPYHACHAPDNAISSCFDLLGDSVQRVLVWVMAVLAVVGNMTVIVYRVVWENESLRTGYGLFVINLGISDFIMGVYLLIIAGADSYYRDMYVLFDKTWRYSTACTIAGFLSVLSCETSTVFVFLITLERYLVIKFPFGQIKFSTQSKTTAILFSWIVGSLIALAPIVFNCEIYTAKSICLGLPLTTKRLSGWMYASIVLVVFNLSLCFIIVCGQRAIFRIMSEKRINGVVLNSSPRREKDKQVAKQLSLVALSNFLCWFPIGVMSFLSIAGHDVSSDVYSWTTVIVLPINSAVNPLLYTIPALVRKMDKV